MAVKPADLRMYEVAVRPRYRHGCLKPFTRRVRAEDNRSAAEQVAQRLVPGYKIYSVVEVTPPREIQEAWERHCSLVD